MSIFSTIMSKIFHHPSAAAPAAAAPTTAAMPADLDLGTVLDGPGGGMEAGAGAASPTAGAAAVSAPASVDVGAVLSQMASAKGGGGNYQTSIVDLLKLLDLDSSLQARTALGQELGVHAGADGSAEQNVALHKAVVRKLAENGGVVPASMMG